MTSVCVSLLAVGDGRLGYPEGAPYDAIHVGAAAATVPKAVRTTASSYYVFLLYSICRNKVNLILTFLALGAAEAWRALDSPSGP